MNGSTGDYVSKSEPELMYNKSFRELIVDRPIISKLLQDGIVTTDVIDKNGNDGEFNSDEEIMEGLANQLINDHDIPSQFIEVNSGNAHSALSSNLTLTDFEYTNGVHNRVFVMQQHNEVLSGFHPMYICSPLP